MTQYDLVEWLSGDNTYLVHVAVLVLLILGGFGFPVPEDIPILLGGVAAGKGIVSLKTIFVSCYVGVMVADQIIYFIGYYFGPRLLRAGTRSRFFPSINEENISLIRQGLRRRKLLYIFIGRHLFPVRTVTFLTAGLLRIPYVEFLAADAMAALVSVSIVLMLGWYLGEVLTPEVIEHILEDFHYYLLILVLFSLVIFAIKKRLLRLYRKPQLNHARADDGN